MSENSEILSVNFYDQVLLEILTCKRKRFFDFFAVFYNSTLTLICSTIDIYFLLEKYESGDRGLSFEWSKKFLALKSEKLSKFEVDVNILV